MSILDALCPPGEMRVIDRRPRPCPECNGHGQMYHYEGDKTLGCEACGGTGTVDTPTLRGLAGTPFTIAVHDGEDNVPAYRLTAVGDTEGQAS